MPFRIECRSLPVRPVVALLASLAAVALALSDLPGACALLTWFAAAAACMLEWKLRGTPVQALTFDPPHAVRIEWPGGRHADAELRGWRRLGPLLVVEAQAGRAHRVGHWLPGSSMNERRRLLRQLARMRPVAGASV